MKTIAIDMTPVRPGGENGGAKVLTLELLKAFRRQAPQDHFILLTAEWNHEELAELDGPNMERLSVLSETSQGSSVLYAGSRLRIVRFLMRIARGVHRSLRIHTNFKRQLQHKGANILFCPFSSLTYAERNLPAVVILYDLQHRDYPGFFHPQEVALRDDFMRIIRSRADAVICISEHTRKAFIRHFGADPQKCHTVPICIQTRLQKLSSEALSENLRRLGLERRRYMFYPANFWPHKNHAVLLTAYQLFRHRNKDLPLDLVFTGAQLEGQNHLHSAVAQMGLSPFVHFMGYLPESELAAVWQGCEFLIFPSLHEGFGIPILESMQFEKPVLCSNTTSLPEVAGDAALYFDPRSPEEIAGCIERFMRRSEIAMQLVEKGRQQLQRFQKEDMAKRYLEILHATARN